MESILTVFGILSTLISGYFYGSRADDIDFKPALLVGIGSYFMNFMVFGALLTICWLACKPFGIHIGFSQPLVSFGGFWLFHIGFFFLVYAIARPLRIAKLKKRDF
jgi:hypothetical protein